MNRDVCQDLSYRYLLLQVVRGEQEFLVEEGVLKEEEEAFLLLVEEEEQVTVEAKEEEEEEEELENLELFASPHHSRHWLW